MSNHVGLRKPVILGRSSRLIFAPWLTAILFTAALPDRGHAAAPDDFPRFIVPEHQAAMDTLRDLYWLHYAPAGPMATLWDEWLSGPTLWPAVASDHRMDTLRERWASALSNRRFDAEGYVASHQHGSIAHQDGWPFPFWAQGGSGAWGWHFSLQHVPSGWHGTRVKTQEGWELTGAKDLGIAEDAWNLDLSEPGAAAMTPPLLILPYQSPFLQLRWKSSGLENARPRIEWTTQSEPEFSTDRSMYFSPPPAQDGAFHFTMIPVYRSPAWRGRITRLRIAFGNAAPAAVHLQALFTQYDTRHNINNTDFIQGCCSYFWWTGDLNFLRGNIERIRLAMAYVMDELGGRQHKCIVTPWVGHDGRSGIERLASGEKIIHSGRGVGNNYWDLLPMGHADAYATIQYYDALRQLARLEEEIVAHPEWNIPRGPLRQEADELRRHAEEVKAHAGKLFWNEATGRFVSGIDIDGNAYDYGFTFINLEAITYGFADARQAESIMAWLSGERLVEGDTSTGADIYHWRFGPRSTTRRNISYYFWAWNSPEKIAWGNQVQDGGAVMGFTYFDLMARLRTRGPDDAWKRLQAIITWFGEVQAAGGYRAYYQDGSRGTLQGGGTPGGLGLDHEFFESILAPQIMIDGFLGFRPRGDGFEIHPRLPRAWPSLTVTRIHDHQNILDITVTQDEIKIAGDANPMAGPLKIYLSPGRWRLIETDAKGTKLSESQNTIEDDKEGISIDMGKGRSFVFSK